MRKVTRTLFQEEDDEEMVCRALLQHTFFSLVLKALTIKLTP